jgi:hypothetical protein
MRTLHSLIHTPSRRVEQVVSRWRMHFARLLLAGQYRVTPNGVLIGDSLLAHGTYFTRFRNREKDYQFDHNMVVGQGILYILGSALGATPKLPAFYIGVCAGTTPVTTDLQANNFAATLNEITSQQEGYTSATRPQWTPGMPAAGVISNSANQAAITIATASQININSLGLISDNARGGTAGTLVSALNLSNTRIGYNGDTLDIGYQVSLTD